MTPEQALQVLQQLASRPSTQLNGLAEATMVADALTVLSERIKSTEVEAKTEPQS